MGVDMHSPGEKQETELKIHQQVPEVYRPCQLLYIISESGIKLSEFHMGDRCPERQHHDADGWRPFDKPVVEVCKYRGKYDSKTDYSADVHRGSMSRAI